MITPAWLLLIWSGLAAACVAAALGLLIGGAPAARWSLAPVPRSRLHGAAWSLVAGMLLYPLVYGVAFEIVQRADVRIGAAFGVLHGTIIFFSVRRTAATRAALRAAAMHLAYGIAIAFFYVTP